MKRFDPGQTWVGVLGGGQLGRMLALEARRMGYRMIHWSGGPEAGPAEVANEVLRDGFDSGPALGRFLERADVATVEFENIPGPLLEEIARHLPMAPGPEAVMTAQHREREKRFLSRHGFPCARYWVVDSGEALAGAMAHLPEEGGILKTAEYGYDGKGQRAVGREASAAEVWEGFGAPRAVLEERIRLAGELSVLVVRDLSGGCWAYDPAENFHHEHILDVSIVPARLPGRLMEEAREMARQIAVALNYVGILAVEFFLTEEGHLLVNELAPRPHNSGHHTLDACETSQFEQQLRMVCELPAGGVRLLCPAVMWNLMGDLWMGERGGVDWRPVLQTPGAKLHLYGKQEPRAGRKMGHVTFLARTREEALEQALFCRRKMAGEAGWDLPEIGGGPGI